MSYVVEREERPGSPSQRGLRSAGRGRPSPRTAGMSCLPSVCREPSSEERVCGCTVEVRREPGVQAFVQQGLIPLDRVRVTRRALFSRRDGIPLIKSAPWRGGPPQPAGRPRDRGRLAPLLRRALRHVRRPTCGARARRRGAPLRGRGLRGPNTSARGFAACRAHGVFLFCLRVGVVHHICAILLSLLSF